MAEIWADWQIDDPTTPTDSQRQSIINQAKLIAGTAAALAEEDVNMAVQMAEESVRWNAIYINKGSLFKNQQAECKELGIATSECGRYHGEKNLETLKEIGLFIIPTTPEEIALAVVTGGVGRYVIKAGGKVISKVFKSKEAAEKVLEEAGRVENNLYRDDSYGYTWSQGRPRDFGQNLVEHWNKHKNEFPEFKSQNDYYRFAIDFMNNPPSGTLRKIRSNGDILIYNPKSNTFMSIDKDGSIRTMFRPNDGIEYWNKQR